MPGNPATPGVVQTRGGKYAVDKEKIMELDEKKKLIEEVSACGLWACVCLFEFACIWMYVFLMVFMFGCACICMFVCMDGLCKCVCICMCLGSLASRTDILF